MAIEDIRRPLGNPEDSVTPDHQPRSHAPDFRHMRLGEELIIEHDENRNIRLGKVRNMLTAYQDALEPHQFSHMIEELPYIEGAVGKIQKADHSLPDSEDNRYLSLKTTLGGQEDPEHIEITQTFGTSSSGLVVAIHSPVPRDIPTGMEQILSEYIKFDTANKSEPATMHREVRNVYQDLPFRSYPRAEKETDILRTLKKPKEQHLSPQENMEIAKQILRFYERTLPPVNKSN